MGLGFTISKRTVERDLDNLKDVFPGIHCNDKSIPYGWHWAPGYDSGLTELSLAEAVSLRIIEDTIRPLLPESVLNVIEPRFQYAAKKLTDNRKNSKLSKWPDKVRSIQSSLTLLPPKIDAAILHDVQKAVLNEKQLIIQYQSMDEDSPSTRTINPLGIVQSGPVTYLVACNEPKHQIRIYAIHRISHAEDAGKRCHIPEDFSLDKYIASGAFQFGSGEKIKLKASIGETLYRILSETPLSHDQKIEIMEDEYILTATVQNTWQLKWWIKSWGEEAFVIST